jgi:plastocyanin
MRKLVLTSLALLTLVLGPSASAATSTVRITSSGFSPSRVTIKTGDAVRWVNRDTKNHQVVANNGAFASPILGPGKSYTFRFRASGTYRYHDGLHPTLRGRVVVTGPPPAVSIGAAQPIVTWGQSVHLAGIVSSHEANQRVTVYSRPYPQASFSQITTVLTTTGGVWDLLVKPTILTVYEAKWRSSTSTVITLGVRPKIGFSVRRGVFRVHVYGDHSFRGRAVYVQRLSGFGQWVKIKKVVLGSGSKKAFRIRKLRKGTSRLRVFMSVNQAGAGYLSGYSRTIKVRRR